NRSDWLPGFDFHNAFFVMAGFNRNCDLKRRIWALGPVFTCDFKHCHRIPLSFSRRDSAGLARQLGLACSIHLSLPLWMCESVSLAHTARIACSVSSCANRTRSHEEF